MYVRIRARDIAESARVARLWYMPVRTFYAPKMSIDVGTGCVGAVVAS
jgi:hypothetical protein